MPYEYVHNYLNSDRRGKPGLRPEELEPEPGDDGTLLICVRVRDMIEGCDYDVQKVVDCWGGCGWELGVSRTGVSMGERHRNVRYVCMQCVLKYGQAAKIVGSAPGSIDAVAELTGRPREEVVEDLRNVIKLTELHFEARRRGRR
jgi:hypothetical protein